MTTLNTLENRDNLRFCTAGSVDDGKSTFVGRLLHDTKSVLADQLASVEATSASRGFDGLDLSLLVDGLRAEREQGITIDVAYRYFGTDKRTFILADTPGHVQYTRNTVTGVSTSQVVVLLVDARNGVVDQTITHLKVAALMGVKTVILAVNKIDLVDYSEDRFREIAAEFIARAAEFGVAEPIAVPISALKGDNVVEKSTNMDWYDGPTVLEILETVPVTGGRAEGLGFRFPIQYVIREHASDYRGYAGQIAAGTVHVGDTVEFDGGSTTIARIDTTDGPVEEAVAGDSVVLILDGEFDLTRGSLIADTLPEAVRTFDATLVGVSDEGVTPGKQVLIRYGTSLVRGKVSATVGTNDIVPATITLAEPLHVETYAARGAVGSFIVVDKQSGSTLAAGLAGARK